MVRNALRASALCAALIVSPAVTASVATPEANAMSASCNSRAVRSGKLAGFLYVHQVAGLSCSAAARVGTAATMSRSGLHIRRWRCRQVQSFYEFQRYRCTISSKSIFFDAGT